MSIRISSILLLAMITIIGCSKKQTVVSQTATTVVLDSLSKEKIKTTLLELSTASSKEMEGYDDFEHLRNLIKSLHTANAHQVYKHADSAYLLVQNLKENLTSDLKTNPIQSRIAVLTTETGLLTQLVNSEHYTADKLMAANDRLITAYNSLIIQLNELSLAIPDNIEKELLRDNEILKDSTATTISSDD